ncbi:unnamed protein product [Leptosia nina]|uniref:Alpha 1,4-glycosyltransferase domain-containing protein n=1 Tax=Leptosia nina TaxID=320188 RepID=A0AAV1JE49_9NEOP
MSSGIDYKTVKINKIIEMFFHIKMIRRNTLRNVEICVLLCIFAVSFYTFARTNREPTPHELIFQNKLVNISCHYDDEDNALPTFEPNFKPGDNSIFFHETSCKGTLNSRQMCAIESAARLHRDRLRIKEYAARTPLEPFIEKGTLVNSSWGIENTSNALRFLTLYKWNGIYLDTDVVVVKSFDSLGGNWVGKEDFEQLNSAAIALDDYTQGRQLAKMFLSEIVNNYNSNIWVHNGPGVVTRVLSRYCRTKYISLMTLAKCQGFSVLDTKYLYPIHYKYRKRYFRPGKIEDTPDAYMHHIWNRLTHHLPVPKDSLYAELAKKYCPSVYELYGDEFGI